jgi:hypothetical protein
MDCFRKHRDEPEVAYYVNFINPALSTAERLALNTNVRLVKYSTGITLASVTAKLSIASPYLVTTSSVDMRPYALIPGVQIVISDGSKTATFTGNTPGSGKTVGDEKHNDPGFANSALWTVPAPDWSVTGGQATINANSSISAISQSNVQLVSAVVVGELYETQFTIAEITSGGFASRLTGQVSGITRTTTGTFVDYLTANSSATGAGIVNTNVVTVGKVDNKSLKKVLTADTSGFNATACTAEAGFNGNAASFTATITIP